MKLHQVPKNTWIRFEGEELFFYHIDGMYSYCKRRDKVDEPVIHLAAFAEVEIISDSTQK